MMILQADAAERRRRYRFRSQPLPDEADAPALVMMVLTVVAAVTIVLWPLARALARRLEGRSGTLDAALQGRGGAAPAPAGRGGRAAGRVAELEERLDFTERLLVRGQTPGTSNGVRRRDAPQWRGPPQAAGGLMMPDASVIDGVVPVLVTLRSWLPRS